MTTKINKSHLMLMKIVEKDGNKNCADCGTEGTRWASWNFGIFLCIRCAGIHRKLGVHISKVKSVDLDSWTSEQLQMMESIGNTKSQKIYEALLPDNFMRPQSNYGIEEFIRAKYQHKRYCPEKPKTPPSSVTTENDLVTLKTTEPSKKSNDNKMLLLPIVDDDNDKEKIDYKQNVNNDIHEQSDDSLSDPDYLMIDLKNKRKQNSCSQKVVPDGNLINFDPKYEIAGTETVAKDTNSKAKILSLYNHQSDTKNRYQSSFLSNSNSFSNHKSYGSSVNNQCHYTTSIPLFNQNNYLEKIQDKLKILKVNLTSRFKQYENTDTPSCYPVSTISTSSTLISSYQPTKRVPSFHESNFSCSANPQNLSDGLTLSPDLWR